MQEKLNLLKNTLGECWNNNDEYLFRCPKCSHEKKKLSLNIEKGVFKCWVCDYHGKDISSLMRRYATPDQFGQWLTINNQVDISKYEYIFSEAPCPTNEESVPNLDLPSSFRSLLDKENMKSAPGPLKYLASRGIDFSTCLKWRIGYCDTGVFAGRIIVPSFDIFGRLNYFIARTYKEEFLKYKNPPTSKDVIFNDLDIDWGRDIVLVEGVFDAMRCQNAIPLLGSSIGEDSRLFKKICLKRPRVFLALDADAKEKEFIIYKKLRNYGIEVYSVDISPFADVGEMSASQFEEKKSNASFINDIDYLKYKINF